MNNKKILNIFTLCILILIPVINVFSLYLEKFNVIESYGNINASIILYLSVPFLLYIYINDIVIKKRKLDIYDYSFYLFIFMGIFSTLFSINKVLSIFGKDFRYEGFLSVFCYYLLFMNWKVNANYCDVKKYIKILTNIGIVNSIYALLQIYFPSKYILEYSLDSNMASGLCGNPNFFGSLIVTVICIICCNFLMLNSDYFKNFIYAILLYISLINCQSTGPFITFILCIVMLIIFLAIKKKLILKRALVFFFLLPLLYIGVLHINNLNNNYRCEMCIVKETIETGGNGRLNIWKKSLNIVSKNLIVGVGFDNFHLAYEDNNYIEYQKIDNAHNVYLHILATQGLIGLVIYLFVCISVFIKGIKSKNIIIYSLLSGFISYSIQALFNISVIQVAPVYYLIMGLIGAYNE